MALSARGKCHFHDVGILNSVLGNTTMPNLDNIVVGSLHVAPSLTWSKETMERFYLLWLVAKKVFLHHKYKLGWEEVHSTWEEEAGVIELGGGLSDDDWARVVMVVDKIKKQCRRTI